jgi:HSP20 family protein
MLNVYASADGAVLTAEVPGIDPEKLDIAVHQDTVSIKGSRELEDFGHEAVVHRQERPSGTFARSFVLPFHVAVDKVSARFDRGILHLDLPRPDEDKPRQIKITH